MIPNHNTVVKEARTITRKALITGFLSQKLIRTPAYQRAVVYMDTEALPLVQSWIEGSLPQISLWQTPKRPQQYDLLDGLQRLTIMARFTGLHPDLPRLYSKTLDWEQWTDKDQKSFLAQEELITVYISNDPAFGQRQFTNINTAQKLLTTAEQRHGRYSGTDFMNAVQFLAKQHRGFFTGQQIVTPTAYARKKGEELIAQLLAGLYVSFVNEGTGLQVHYVASNTMLERVISEYNNTPNQSALKRAQETFTILVNEITQACPLLYETRFRRLTDFKALFSLFWHSTIQGLRPTSETMDRLYIADTQLAQNPEYLTLTKGGVNRTATPATIQELLMRFLQVAFVPNTTKSSLLLAAVA